MKKFFAFIAIALVAFGFAACNQNKEVEQDNFAITISDITAKTVHIAVTPADTTKTYYWDILPADTAAKMTDEQIAVYFKEYFDYVIEYYAYYYEMEVTYADLLLKGKDEYDFSKLDPNTEYVVASIYLDANLVASGKATRKNFKTLEEKEDPVPADMTFQIAASDLTFASANIAVTPSTNEATYYWNLFEAEKIAEVSDADLCAAIKEDIEETIELYELFGYDLSFEDFLSKGPDAYEFDELTSNTAYTVIAVAMGTLGTTNGAVAKYNFQTPELVAEDSVDLVIGETLIRDYRDLDGSIMIAALAADSSLYFYLTPYSMTLDGEFTIDSLDLDYSGLYDYTVDEKYAIADAEFTGVAIDEKSATYEGWFLATNAIKYNFSFTAELEADEEAMDAPARIVKKTPSKKNKAFFKKGNLEKKNSTFVSEKLLKR